MTATLELTPEEKRVLKAYRFFRDNRDEVIASYRKGAFWFESESKPGHKHKTQVTLEHQNCSCPDKQVNKVEECWHIVCATIAKAESAPCECCRVRLHRSHLKQVKSEDSMTFFPGQWVCSSCLAGTDAAA